MFARIKYYFSSFLKLKYKMESVYFWWKLKGKGSNNMNARCVQYTKWSMKLWKQKGRIEFRAKPIKSQQKKNSHKFSNVQKGKRTFTVEIN